jgi:hypothetical protein
MTGTGTVAEFFNGTAWGLGLVPKPVGQPLVTLNSIQCVSASRCYAVGAGATQSIAATLDGTVWHEFVLKAPGAGTYARLHGVSCPTFSSCTAVGEYSMSTTTAVPFAARLATGAWSTYGLPVQVVPWQSAPWLDNEMWGVSCVGTTACTAAGYSSSFDVSIGAAQSLS